MKNFRYIIALANLLFVAALFIGCSGNSTTNSTTNEDPNNNDGNGNPQIVFRKWAIDLKGYNVVEPPATLQLSFLRYDEAGPDLNYKYQLKPGQPWIDVSNQVNAVGIGEWCDIPLTFTEPGKYSITGRLYYSDDTWTGLYESFFVLVKTPVQ